MINSRAERYCQTCGTHLKGKYCHNCGEKYLEPEDKSVKKWIGHLFSDIWMLDGKLLRTLKGLLLFPGRLAQDYTKGKRVPYLKPLNLFLLINLVYFLSPTLDTFTTQLYTQMHGLPHSPMVERTVEGYLADEGITFEELAPVYDKKTNEVSKLIIIVLAPLLGLVVYGLFFKQGIYLSDGFNLALQFWAFFLLIFMIILPNLSRLLDKLFDAAFFTSDTYHCI